MAKKAQQKESIEEKPVDIQNDEYRGQGGSYVFNPATGKRTRIAGPALEAEQKPAAEPENLPQTENLNHESQ